jgi:hypothetical protein
VKPLEIGAKTIFGHTISGADLILISKEADFVQMEEPFTIAFADLGFGGIGPMGTLTIRVKEVTLR